MMSACSKERKLAKRLEGIWALDRLELTFALFPDSPIVANDLGTVTFNKGGTGKNDFSYSYTLFDQTYEVNDSEAFKWENTDTTVSIEGNANDGEKTIVWSVDDNEKDTQVWTRTDVDGNDWELTLPGNDEGLSGVGKFSGGLDVIGVVEGEFT
jgi:hypothetical protein